MSKKEEESKYRTPKDIWKDIIKTNDLLQKYLHELYRMFK